MGDVRAYRAMHYRGNYFNKRLGLQISSVYQLASCAYTLYI